MSDPYRLFIDNLEQLISGYVARAMVGLHGELGTITATGLKLDNFKHEITKYLVAEHLTLKDPDFTKTETDGSHNHPCAHASSGGKCAIENTTHQHQVITPEKLKKLQPGDRVMVIPVNKGQEFVVVARVVSNAKLISD